MSNTKWTPGDWKVYNMVHAETGEQLTPEQIGEYVTNAVKLGSPDRFLFISADKPDGAVDICHVGNGPDGPFNAHLIKASPNLYEALDELRDLMQDVIDGEYKPDSATLQVADRALAEARGES